MAGPTVKALEIVTAECKRLPIKTDADGVFFHLVSGADAVAGRWPIRVIAYDAGGAVISSVRLPVTTPDPDSPFAQEQPSCP